MNNIRKIFLTISLFLALGQLTFSQNYNINNVNGTTINDCSLTLYDSGGNGGAYGTSESYTVTICSGTAQGILLNFASFATESGYDYLYVYNGPTTASPQVAGSPFNGSVVPGNISTTGTCVTIRFTSDASVTYAGFQINMTCITLATPTCSDGIQNQGETAIDCGGPCPACTNIPVNAGNQTTCNGSFTDTGGSAGNYGLSEDYTITFTPNSTCSFLQFVFSSFATESVTFDWLKIYNGPNILSPLIGTYGGTTSPGTVIATNASGALTFVWHSDGSVASTGWVASISCITGTQCSGTPSVATAVATPNVLNCAVTSTVLSATNLAANCGNTYQWQSAPTAGGPWTNIAGATSSTLTASPTSNTYYHVITTCSNSGLSSTSSSVLVSSTFGPPVNDNCANAISVTVNPNLSCGSVTSGTVACASASGVALGTCFGTADDDVWFSFVATSTTHTLDLTNITGSTTDLYHSVYSGTCSSLSTAIICSDPNNSTLNGLIVGQTYYIRVYSYYATPETTTFSLCVGTPVPPPPCSGTSPAANDNCAIPTPICEFEGYCGNTSASYTAGSIPPSFCGSVENNSWLSFTASAATATLNIYVSGCVNGWGIQMEIYSTTDCVSFTSFSNCWNPGIQTNGTITATGLTPGNTYLLMIDGNAGDVCNYVISAGSGIFTANAIVTQTGVNSASVCAGQTVNLQASGGTTYSWTPTTGLSNPNIANPTATPTTTTTYNCNITGGNPLCPSTQAVQVTITVSSGLTVTTAQTNPTCNGGNNGTASVVSATGGTAPFTYVWSGGLGTNQSVTGLSAGTYYVTTTSTNGCYYVSTITLANPALIVLTPSMTQATCGLNNGTATVNVTSGGTSPWDYQWSTTASTMNVPSTTNTISGLAAGTYTVTVTDNNSCSKIITVTVTSTSAVTSTFTNPINQCSTGSNSFNFINTGSTGVGYTQIWSFTGGPANITTVNAGPVTWVAPGTYTITHTVTGPSPSFCSSTTTNTITVYPLPAITPVTQTNLTCNGGLCNGTATAPAGVGYNYLWNTVPAQTTQTATALCASTYTVTITNSNSCISTTSVTITQPAAIALTPTRTDVNCFGLCNGTANVAVVGGTSPYTYNWGSGTTPLSASTGGLCVGIYTVTVRDVNLCTATVPVNIAQPPALTSTISGVNPACSVGATGSVNLTPSGGTLPYTFLWSNGATTEDLSGVAAGTYAVTIAGVGTCTTTTSITLTAPSAITSTIVGTNPACSVGATGSVNLTPTGGTLPYTFLWSNGATTEDLTGVAAGSYTVTITGVGGCNATATTTLTAPSAITSTIVGTNPACSGGLTGAVNLTPSGGTLPYAFLWSNGTTTEDLTGVAAGSYTVTITGVGGCNATANITLIAPSALTASISGQVNVNCFGGSNGTATVTAGGGTAPYTYLWSIGAQTTATATGLSNGTYTVTVTDFHGCILSTSVTITQPVVLTASTNGTPASCNGGANGTATVTPAGGTGPYTYGWVNLQTTQTATGLIAGTYGVTVTDSHGCTVASSYIVTQPVAISLTPSNVNATCAMANGSASIAAVGGTSPYTYLWSNGGNTSSIINILAGAYTVTVTDFNGCTATNTINVNNSGAPTANITANTNVSCNGGSNGSATVTAAGGSPGYTYVWNNPIPVQTTATCTGLIAGIWSVTVTDLIGCQATASVTITQPTALTSSITGQTNVSCSGGANGTATVAASGGTTGYTYLWNNPIPVQTTAIATNLTNGTWTVTVTDAQFCTSVSTVTITQPSAVVATITGQTNVSCNGGTNGTATVAGSGGTPGYTYNWSNSQSTAIASGLGAATYQVTVTDLLGCTATNSVTITQLAAVTASISGQANISCNGGANGAATVTAGGGLPGYTYLWNNPLPAQTTANATLLTVGVWSVTVTDANLCTATTTVNITQPTVVTATISGQTNVSCNGGSNGSATVTPGGGTPGYTYLWNDPIPAQLSAVSTNLTVGTWTVTVSDFNLCTATASVIITEPTPLTSSISTQTNVSCNGGSNGQATVSGSGGILPFTYLWSDPIPAQITATAITLTNGIWTVTVTDANLCTSVSSVTITQPPVLTASIIGTNVLCNAGTTGSADLTVGGGTPTYSYNWSNSASSQDITGLTANTYNVTVTDNLGCSITSSVVIGQPTAVTVSITANNGTSGFGICDGSATAAGANGSPGYTYSWTSGSVIATASGLCAGTYTVTVTDLNGCTATTTVTIVEPNALTVNITATTNVLCNGVCSGSATFSVTGGVAPYGYLWPGGQTTNPAIGLCDGSYTVTVTDNNGITGTATAMITEPTTLTSSIGAQTNVSCNGGNNGTATVAAGGGTSPYTYLWNASAQTTVTATTLTNGTWTVTVSDANLCTSVSTVTITQPVLLTANIAGTNILCSGLLTGAADLTVLGGTSPFNYNWTTTASTQDLTGIAAGTYSVTVTDALLCTAIANIIIIQPSALTATTTSIAAHCGQADGSATVIPAGGTPGYTNNWSNSQTNLIATGLLSATYNVTVYDANSCSAISSVFVNNLTGGIASVSANTPVSCFGGSNGTATATMPGAVSYLWDNGIITATASNLNAGNHLVTVTDNNGCVSVASVTILQPTVLTSTVVGTATLCNGSSNGSADLTVSGGTPVYTYIWSNGALTQDLTNVIAGIYTVTISDANSCSITNTVTITQPTVLSATISGSTNVSCSGGTNGTAVVTGGGGTPGYIYLWNGGSSNTLSSNVGFGAGNYTVTVTDANLCTATAFVTITQPTPVSVVTSSVSENCGQANGSATVVASGGTVTGGYIYNWSGGATTTSSTTTGLSIGLYTITVTDNNGCTATGSVNVLNIAPGTASISSSTNVTCNGLCNGSATVSVGGGAAPFTYLWSNAQTLATATGLCVGSYTVSATDANGCILTTSVTLTQPAILANTITPISPTCYGGCDGILNTVVTGGTSPYTYQWNDPTLQTNQNATSLCMGTYSVTVRDANLCSLVSTEFVTQPPQITTAAVAVDAHCSLSDGSLALTTTNGAAPFTYLWSNSAVTQNLTGVPAGSYSVTVTDFKGCTGTGTFAVNNISGPLAVISSFTNVACFGQCNGVATVVGSGGTSPYTYLWDNAQSSQTGTALCVGTHSVTVTDIYSCNAIANVVITEPLALISSTSFVAPSCNNLCNGTATTIVGGGTAPYTYNWTNNDHFATADSLCSGSYTVIVTDAHLCTTSNTITVTQPSFVAINMTSTPVLCNGACNGTATATPAGGIPPYTYLWSDLSAQTTPTASGLCAGSYTVSVYDLNGCLQTSNVTITQPTVLSSSINNPTNISCFGGNNGSAQVTVTGGSPGYTFIWSNNQVTQSISNLTAGVYSVTVADLNGCTTTSQIILTEPPILSVSLSAINESCFNACNGTINTSITGGTGPYVYAWTNAQNTANINNLCVGSYTVTVTDSHGCSIISTAVISGPPSLQVVVTGVVDADCGQPNGSATVAISGGTGSIYSYSWTPNVSSSATLNNVIAGAYTVTVTDVNNCTATTTVNVNNNLAPVITNIAVTNVSCYGGNNGTATVTYTSTTLTNAIQWSDPMGQSTTMAIGLNAGNYFVVITDANGCTVSGNASITQPQQMNAIINGSTSTLCYGSCNGSAMSLSAGGTPPYTYIWSDPTNQTTQTSTGLCAGFVSVMVTDANGCTAMANTTINQPTQVQATGTTTAVNCNGGSDGSITASQTGGTPGYIYNWMPFGGTTSTAANLPAGTVFTVYVTDLNGCTAQAGFILSEPIAIAITTTTNPATCNQDNGTAMSFVTGGTPGYTYNWSPSGSVLSSANNLAPGNHLLTVIDAHNCPSSIAILVSEMPMPELISVNVTNTTCYGSYDGKIQIQIVNGLSPFNFIWSPYGGPDSVSSNLMAGTYVVSIYDANSCQIVTPPIIVNQPTPVVVFANGSDSICIGQSITISASANGGTPGYTYQWNGGGASQSYTVNPLTTTNYTVTATDSHGCTSAVPGNVIVYVNPPLNVTLPADVNICQGQTYSIIPSTTGGNGGPYLYNWNIGSGNPNEVSPLSTTTYIVTVNDLCNSPTDNDTLVITVHPLPSVVAPPLTATGCNPLVVTFNNVVSSTDSVSYVWSFGDPSSGLSNVSGETVPTHLYETVGSYNVGLTLTTQYGCQLVSNYPNLVVVTPSPIASFYMYPTEVGLFDANIHFYDQSSYATSWSWSFGDGGNASVTNPQHEYAYADTFNVILVVRGLNGCMDTASLPLIIRDEHTFYAPSAFTPNAGLNNNFFYPKGMGFDPNNYYLGIYDRWGQVVFETTVYPTGTESVTEIDGGWNGRYKNKGEIVPIGTYTWVVKMKDVNGLYHEYVGPVTVVR